MKTYTRATVIGHIGNEVVMRHTANGKAVVNLSIATSLLTLSWLRTRKKTLGRVGSLCTTFAKVG